MTTSKHGPLTARQERIIELISEGKRHRDITTRTGIPLNTVKHEMSVIVPKMGAETSAQACATYATAVAYRNAAAQILGTRVRNSDDPSDVHVNHVLEGIAQLFQEWSAMRLPK